VGLGASSAARGLLVHRVALLGEADRATIADYRILAPTEWNFHPAGVVATALSELGERIELDAPQLEARARLVVTAVDPCVDYRLGLN
jgi:coenzyme F420-reducing hydrogenase alpha subunit